MSVLHIPGAVLAALAMLVLAQMLMGSHGSAVAPTKQASAQPPDAPQPRIVELEPDSIEVTGHDVRLRVRYVIPNVDEVETATLQLRSYPPARIWTYPVDVAEENTVELVFRALGNPIDRWLTEPFPPGLAGAGQLRGLDVSIQTKSPSDPDRPYGKDNVATYGDMRRVPITDRLVYRGRRP